MGGRLCCDHIFFVPGKGVQHTHAIHKSAKQTTLSTRAGKKVGAKNLKGDLSIAGCPWVVRQLTTTIQEFTCHVLDVHQALPLIQVMWHRTHNNIRLGKYTI